MRSLIELLARVAALDREPGLRLWAVGEVLGPLDRVAPAPLTRARVRLALERTGGNETRAAELLGVSRGKLRRFLARVGRSPAPPA